MNAYERISILSIISIISIIQLDRGVCVVLIAMGGREPHNLLRYFSAPQTNFSGAVCNLLITPSEEYM